MNTENLSWIHFSGSKRFDYPIHYSVCCLSVDSSQNTIEFLSRWYSNSYCHYHRHLGETYIKVLEGEHNIVEINDHETVHKKRYSGFESINSGGDSHMEYGGPDGCLVYFRCKAVNGKLFEVLDKDGTVLSYATIDDFTKNSGN